MEYVGENPSSSTEHSTSNLCTGKCLANRVSAASHAAKIAYVLSLNMSALLKIKAFQAHHFTKYSSEFRMQTMKH
jgi:hypothetical protein